MALSGTVDGQTNPAGMDGQIATASLLLKPLAECTATVGGLAASVLYCAAVPFVVEGEFQLNLQLSSDLPSGNQPVVVQIGSVESQPNPTVFVK